MTDARSYQEVQAEIVAEARAAIDRAMAADAAQQRQAERWLSEPGSAGVTPVTPPHTD